MKFRYKEKRYNGTVACGEIIKDIASEIGLSDEFILEHIRSIWKKAVGDIIATHSYPYKIVNRTLYVTVDHPIYANEIIVSQPLLIERLSNFLGTIAVDLIKCTIKKEPQRKGSDVHTYR